MINFKYQKQIPYTMGTPGVKFHRKTFPRKHLKQDKFQVTLRRIYDKHAYYICIVYKW